MTIGILFLKKHLRDFMFTGMTALTIWVVMSMFFVCQECKDLSKNCSKSTTIGNLTLNESGLNWSPGNISLNIPLSPQYGH